jgi:hypothetical protein
MIRAVKFSHVQKFFILNILPQGKMFNTRDSFGHMGRIIVTHLSILIFDSAFKAPFL